MPKKQARGVESKKKKPGVSRRNILKMGATAGGITLLTSTKARGVFAQSVAIPEPTPCSVDDFTGSPATRPFRQQLPIPPALQSTTLNPAPRRTANIAAGEAPRAAHQRWDEFLPVKQYA